MKFLLKVIVVFFIVLGFSNAAHAQCGEEMIEFCYPKLGEFKYINNFPIKQKKAKRGDPPAVMKHSLVLNSGTKYRFAIYNATEYDGKLVVNIYSSSTLVGTSYDYATGKYYDVIEFDCKKPGIYYICFYFDGGKEGCSMCVMGNKEWKGK